MKSGLFVPKQYFEHPNADFRGNPLIEWLPPLTRELMARMLVSPVAFNEGELQHAPELRIQYVTRLGNWFLPLDEQIDFAMGVWDAVCKSLGSRNPTAPSAEYLLDHLIDFLSRNDETTLEMNTLLEDPSCITLFGTPGTGKSRIINALFSRLPRGVMFHRHANVYQALWVKVCAPGNGKDQKTLAWTVYEELFKLAVGAGLVISRLNDRASSGRIRQAVYELVVMLNVGCIMVDELQHMIRGSVVMDVESMKFLTDLINALRIPIVLLGTWQVVALLSSELRLGRRSISPASAEFRRMEEGEDFDIFVKAAMDVQFTQKRCEWSPLISQTIYKYTLGIQDLVVKLLQVAQIEAIRSECEVMSATLIEECAKQHFSVVAPAIRMMREGVKEDDDLLWDLEPKSFEEYLKALSASAELDIKSRRGRRKIGPLDSNRHRLAKALNVLELASPGAAELIAGDVTNRHPADNVAQHMRRVLDDSLKRGPKPTKAISKLEKVDAEFEALDHDDVRRINYFAGRTNQDFVGALTEAGYFGPLAEDLPLH